MLKVAELRDDMINDLVSEHILYNKVKDLTVAFGKKRSATRPSLVFPMSEECSALVVANAGKARFRALYDIEKNTIYPSINEIHINDGKVVNRLPRSAYLSFDIEGEAVDVYVFSSKKVGFVAADSEDAVVSLFRSFSDADKHPVQDTGE